MAGQGQGPSIERVVSEAYCKAAEVILEARIPARTTAQTQQKSRAWFNLEVEEVEGAAKALERWRREAGLPLVLEIFLQPWGAQAAAAAGGQHDRAVETLLERWVVHYFPQLPEGPSHLSRSQLSRLNPSSVYKRLVITLRSLYTYVRVLPAYRMYRACRRQRGANFSLGYRLHSTLPGRGGGAAAAPGGRRMQSFRFGPVDTPYGQFRIAVDHQPASAVTILEQTTSPPPLPQIIADYVGGGSGHQHAAPLRHAASTSLLPGPAAAAQQALGPASQQQAGQPASPAAAPGSSPRVGGMPIRRSWSTSLRGASPARGGGGGGGLASQPSSELPSPVSARDVPYGSAPQQAVSLPAMLRALSSTPGRGYVVGSPAGRPPLAKPPRATSAPIAALPGAPGAHAAVHGSSADSSAPLRAAALAGEEGEEGGSEAGTPRGGSAGSAGSRQSSAPMSIPGRGGGGGGGGGGGFTAAQGRRLRSSNDLWALQEAAAQRKPLSAPAVSHMQQAAGGGGGGAAAAGSAEPGGRGAAAAVAAASASPVEPSPRAHHHRLSAIPGAVDSESSGSAASSLYPTSCSPQLPFAFTPSAQSLASFGARGPLQESARLERTSPHLVRTPSSAGSGGGSVPHQAVAAILAAQQQQRGAAAAAGAAASPAGAPSSCSPGSGGSGGGGGGGAVVGREVPAHTALMRRPSWSGRSSTYGQLGSEASQQGVGYSVSPMQDPALESMLAGSTPRQYTLAGALPPPLAGPAGLPAAPGGGGGAQHRVGSTASAYGAAARPLLTFPAAGSASGGGEEGDEMPFALDDGSASPLKPRSPAPASPALPAVAAAAAASPAPPLPVSTAAGAASPAGPAAAAEAALVAAVPPTVVDTDAAVGAFVRLIQEAPPLRLHPASRPPTRAASADLASARLAAAAGAAAPGTSSGSDSSAATCLSDGRGLTLQAGLRQFSKLKERLQARGVVVPPLPAEA